MKPHPAASYATGTQAVLFTLRELSAQNQVEARLYSEPPIWQWIKLPNELWLMSAAADNPTDLSPLWVLKTESPYSLAWGLRSVWERRWDTASPFDLTTVVAPAAADVLTVQQP